MYAGTHDLSLGDEPHRVVVATRDAIIHPDWNPSTLSNDIALIKLPQKIEFTDGKSKLKWVELEIQIFRFLYPKFDIKDTKSELISNLPLFNHLGLVR